LPQGGETDAVREQPAHSDVLLARGLELRPVLGDGSVEVQLTPLREEVCADRRDALGRREDELEGVLLPRAARLLVGCATPDVDDLLALDVQREGRADLLVLDEVALERRTHRLEARLYLPA